MLTLIQSCIILFKVKIFSFLLSIFPENTAYAHCDVPCGIYTPHAALNAAKTVLIMDQKLLALAVPDTTDTKAVQDLHNNSVRMIWTKEEHARICKHELATLWSDYFKPEHLELFPDLHDVFWNALKLCSKAKQTVDVKVAEDLLKQVEKIALMFKQAEDAKAKASSAKC